jgi:HSP20 family protein
LAFVKDGPQEISQIWEGDRTMALLRFENDIDPFRALLSLQDELDRFRRNPAFATGPSGFGAYPPVNIFDSAEGALVVAEIPGLDPANLAVTGAGHTLTLSGERQFEPDGKGRGYHRRELNEGKFSRSIQLPEDYEAGKAEARYEAGLLIVRVPRAEHATPRQISVQSA